MNLGLDNILNIYLGHKFSIDIHKLFIELVMGRRIYI